MYSVHGLIHIAEDVKRFGPLDSYSAFPFENYLGHLKQLLRKPQSPLQQIRRVEERQGILTRQTKNCSPENVPKKRTPSRTYSKGYSTAIHAISKNFYPWSLLFCFTGKQLC